MLYIVPTPLGNLEDISVRCLKALREAAGIYCEDTRRTRKLLSHYSIHTPIRRYRENARSMEEILLRLKGGETLALACDSGMPVISDPGWKIVASARKEGLQVSALPGPCAVPTAVAGSGLPGDSFIFLGFLPRSRSKQKRLLKEAASLNRTIALYESPRRVVSLLQAAAEVLGPASQVALAREMSKAFEEWITGTLEEVLAKLEGRKEILGECTVVIHPSIYPIT